ncbi:MAG TPA: homocitrate synthase [Firmicutes bacterium]|jgi:homocitrate synthase NifV|nr:homocitrate synthase [Bacillota bacterium]
MDRLKKSLEKNEIIIVDTTLRDGEQTAGVVFSNQEKIRIAKMLDEIGVQQIEVGVPVMGGNEKAVIKKIAAQGLGLSLMAWNRANINDIIQSLDCGVDAVAISISTSDIHIKHKLRSTREQVLKNMVKATEFAKKHGVYISVNAEDSSRTDFEFLVKFALAAKEAGADRLRYCDTVGILEPFKTYEIISKLIERTGMDIEMHTHNDFGMATATSLAGVRAGARFVGVTVNGLGERAGNAALEEVTMALKYILNKDHNIKTQMFRELSEYVARASGRILPPGKAIVGDNMFRHESGIHADGVIKYPGTYEVFNPEDVGLERQIVIGKHSGSKAIMLKFKEYGISLNEDEATELLPMVRRATVEMKRPLFDKELVYIYEDYMHKKYEKGIEFSSMSTEEPI